MINRHFCHFRQHRHFPKGPFAISFVFFLTIWRFWRLSANSAIFTKYAIFTKIATFPKDPFAISFVFLFTVWRFWQLGAISAIFANACISGHISRGGRFGPPLSLLLNKGKRLKNFVFKDHDVQPFRRQSQSL